MGKDLVRKELARVRATTMEGGFGTQEVAVNTDNKSGRDDRKQI